MIRLESEETQDYVCEIQTISPEGAEDPAPYFCDNQCSEKAVIYWQFASVVVDEGGEARTVKLCQQTSGGCSVVS